MLVLSLLVGGSVFVAFPSLAAAEPAVRDTGVAAIPIEIDGQPVTVVVPPDERIEFTYDYDGFGLVSVVVQQCPASFSIFKEMSGTRTRTLSHGCENPVDGPFEPRGAVGNTIGIEQLEPDGASRTYTVSLKRSPADVVRNLVLGGEPVTVDLPAQPGGILSGGYKAAWLNFSGVQGQEVTLKFAVSVSNVFLRGELRRPDLSTMNLQPGFVHLDQWSGTLSQTGGYRIEIYTPLLEPVTITIESSMQSTRMCADPGILPVMLVHGFNGTANVWSTFEPELVNRIRREFRKSGLNDLDSAVCGRQFVRSVNLGPRASSYSNAVLLADKIEAFVEQTGRQIDVIAHSKGGLDTRRAIRLLMATSTPPPRNLLMIATPNAGTPIADRGCGIYNSPIGPAGDYIEDEFGECDGPEDALYTLTQEYVQKSFNAFTLNSPSVVYQTIAGASTCSRCRTLGPFIGDNDGLVPRSSVEHFAPTGQHTPVGVFDAEHSALPHNSTVISRAHCSLAGRTPDPDDCISQVGSSPPGADSNVDQATDSGTDLAHFDVLEVPAAGTNATSLPIGGIGPVGVVVLVDKVGLTGSVGEVDLVSEPTERGEALTAQIETPTDIDLTLTNGGSDDATALILISSTTVPPLQVEAQSIGAAGAQIGITVPNIDPVAGLSGSVTAPSGTRTDLAFTANGADAVANFTPVESGSHIINAFHSGRFQRVALEEFAVATGGAALPGSFAESLETDGNGSAIALNLDVDVEVSEPSTYRLAGRLTTAGGIEVAATESTADLTEGQHQIRLSVSGAIVYGTGEDGPYTVDLTLLRVDPGSEVETIESQTPGDSLTQPYLASNFQPATIKPGYVSLEQGNFQSAVAEIPVTLSEPITRPITVDYASLNPPGDQFAHSPEDFEAVSGTLTFLPGETIRTIPVTVNGNSDQVGNKVAVIGFNNPVAAAVGGSGQGGVAILSTPTAVIDGPTTGFTWSTGDQVSFSGHVDDPVDGPLPASSLSWQLRLHQCPAPPLPGACQTHVLQDWDGVAAASFEAPDRLYPAHLELELMAEGPSGLRHRVVRELHPNTVELTLDTNPPGRLLATGVSPFLFQQRAPFTVTAIQGSSLLLSADPHQEGGFAYQFQSWSQGGPSLQQIQVPTSSTTYTATFFTDVLTIDSPSPAAGQYGAMAAEFGPRPTQTGISGNIVLVNDGSASPTLGCNPLVGFPTGAIALIDRGVCAFALKVTNAQNAGARAVVIINTEPGDLPAWGPADPTITVPSLMITPANGNAIKAGLPAAGSVTRNSPT